MYFQIFIVFVIVILLQERQIFTTIGIVYIITNKNENTKSQI